MVMATPSPQQVGREFVRQYYTVLHEAPDVLHRFYSSGSTFVHGGVDRPGLTEEPVTGQLEIDKKIKLLNFKDCHTKIRQVDSQSTIGNGVVVQVTGELSNNGEPMRRFMQTFVLAPQTPKKFYVHNDIFRYQDEVYQDNSDTESEDPQQSETLNKNTTNASVNMNYYQGNDQQIENSEVNVVINSATNNALVSSLSTSVTSSSSSTSSSSATVSTSPSSQQVVLQEPVVNQSIELADQQTVPVIPNETSTVSLANGHGPVATENEASSQNEESTTPVVTETPELVKEKVVVDGKTTSLIAPKEELNNKQEPVQNAETKSSTGHSWAKIISTGQSTSSMTNLESNTLTGANAQVHQQNQANTSTSNANNTSTQQKRVNGNSSNNYNNNNSSSKGQQSKPRNQQQASQSHQQQQQQQSQQPVQQQQQQSQQQPQQRVDASNLDDSEKRFGRYPDGQQVFVGNLNQDLSETELRSYFGQFGKVIDVRINTNSKQQSGRRLPNYGFVVFDDKQSVENLLSTSKSNSLTYKNEKGVEYRLNVEEKRARQGRMSSGFGGNGGGSGGKTNRATRSSSNGSRNAPNGHSNTNQKKNTTSSNNNYVQSNDNNGPVSGNNGGSGFIERRKTDVHENQMNENGSHRKSNIRRS